MGSSLNTLIAFDTDHIKRYVFGTDRLKEIRGASSSLDFLNQTSMNTLASKFQAERIYTNGGSGLYVIDAALADDFAKSVQRAYREKGASVSYAMQSIPDMPFDVLMQQDLTEELKLLRWRLRDRKNAHASAISLASHPFMSLCSSCGLEYAEEIDDRDNDDEQGQRYCQRCLGKRAENRRVNKRIENALDHWHEEKRKPQGKSLWERLLKELLDAGYPIPPKTQRPRRLDVFSHFSSSKNTEKDYLGLIYADANSMGKKLEELHTLNEIEVFAEAIDNGVYWSLAQAIKLHIPQVAYIEDKIENKKIPTFCFDVLLIGGDDIVILTHASVAMQVATTLAQKFSEWTRERKEEQTQENLRAQLGKSSLSVGVVLAPIKYPFGLLFDLVDEVLKSAKKKGAGPGTDPTYGDSSINFMAVTGNTSQRFEDEFKEHLSNEDDEAEYKDLFYATLRPYSLADMSQLLALIREGKAQRKIGRTKLHQLREAILEKNLTTSVVEGIASLRNWKGDQRDFMITEVYPLGRPLKVPPDPLRTIFPWYYTDKKDNTRDVYCTPLLDFIELYDFIAEGGTANGAEN